MFSYSGRSYTTIQGLALVGKIQFGLTIHHPTNYFIENWTGYTSEEYNKLPNTDENGNYKLPAKTAMIKT